MSLNRNTRTRFATNASGSVTILGAVLLPVLVGVAALVAEFGHGLLAKVQNQRVADLAAFAGANAYASSSSTATMQAAVATVATLNGLPASSFASSVVSSPKGNGNQAVSVTVTTSNLLLLAPVLRSGHTLSISANAQAEIASQAAACIIALKATGTGVTLSGGTALSAPNCGIASNANVGSTAGVIVPCGTTITTKTVTYNSTAVPSQPCNGITAPSGTTSTTLKKAATADPLASNSGVTTATARLATVNATTAPTAPTVTAPTGGTAISFAYDQPATQNAAIAAGCTATWASGTSTWTLTCPAGNRSFAAITVGGGIKVRFNPTGAATNVYSFSAGIAAPSDMTFGPGTYNVSGNINLNGGVTTFGAGTFNVTGTINVLTGATATFGAGTFNVAQGINTGGGTTATFGAGTFNIGPLPASAPCNANERTSICHKGTTLTFGGPSTFSLAAGLTVGGGTTLIMGSGTTNSYRLGPSLGTSGGSALRMEGGGVVKLADATGSGGVFQAAGHINVPGGGSCLTLPATAQHDIKGNFTGAGAVMLGAGMYTVTGYVAFGAGGGGSVTCDGALVGVSGAGVTFTVGGAATYSGSGDCSGRAFCIVAGYNNVTLTAPTTGATAKLIVVGPTATANTAGALFGQGASTSLSGAFYFPNGPINMAGGASVGNGSGQCLELIGSQITLAGGSVLGSSCFGGTVASSKSVLVQ